MASSTYMTVNNLEPPSVAPLNMPQRRMTSPSLAPPETSGLVEFPNERRDLRPPSPLRNGVTYDPSTGEFSDHGSSHQTEEEDYHQWGRRTHSPAPSVTQFAANLVQKVGSFVGGSPQYRNGLPTDAELEAEAERERQQSRLEAERIIMQEEAERKLMEDKIMAMIDDSMTPPKKPLSNPPSPSSNKESGGGWFSAVKNKLTPTKEPLTPAQQIIQETKAREKDKRKTKDKEWPSSASGKLSDPAYVNLASSNVTPPRPHAQSFSSSPTGMQRPISQIQPSESSWSPAFSRTGESPSREGPPLYAQFNNQGVLDIPLTLLTIARRFEKLEKWSVSHVRALEERMSDVEKWLVDKENEKDLVKGHSTSQTEASSIIDDTKSTNDNSHEVGEIREELIELQGRVTELGREMAKFASSTRTLSANQPTPASVSSVTSVATSSGRSLPAIPDTVTRTPSNSSSIAQSRGVSPTFSSNASAIKSRTRLPYPTGDYAVSPNSILAAEEPLSPTISPPSSITQSSKIRPLSVSGLPLATTTTSTSVKLVPNGATSPASPPAVHKERESVNRVPPTSVSPTPVARKRYTVALGGPLVRPGFNRSVSPSEYQNNALKDDTVGKSATRIGSIAASSINTYLTPKNPRVRAQSTYGTPTGYSSLSPSPSSSPSTTSPLKPRLRTRSTDHLALKNKNMGLGISDPSTGKFIDPLVVRRQERENNPPIRSPKVTNARSKVPFGELLAFFDGDHRSAGTQQ